MVNILICENVGCINQNKSFDRLLLWSSFSPDNNAISLPQAVDDNFEKLRERYLQWLAECGQSSVNGKRLVENFTLRPGFSAWWMSLIVEKSQWKSQAAYQAFRLMAFDDMLNDLTAGGQHLVTIFVADKAVRTALINCCKNRDIPYQVKPHKKIARHISVSQLYDKLPYIVQAAVYFLYYAVTRMRVKGRNDNNKLLSNTQQISFFSYFFNVDKKALKQAEFRSGYWGELYEYLKATPLKQNWFHLYVNNPEKTNPRSADKLLTFLDDEKALEHQSHQLLDHSLGWKSWCSVISDYSKLWLAARRARAVQPHFRLSDSAVDLWPLMAADWHDSLCGKTAAMNVIYLHLFEQRLNALPQQALGLYLAENQGWERALIYVWRQAGHGHLIAVPHATTIPCDLRHVFAAEEYKSRGGFALPIPDIVALNGRHSWQQYQANGYPMDKAVEVEALRYLSLGTLTQHKAKRTAYPRLMRLLVLGDYLAEVTFKQMKMVADAAAYLPENLEIYVKSHPACPIIPEDWPDFEFTPLTSPLDELVDRYDIAFASNMTGAALDAFVAGKRVLSMRDADSFNMSPLRGYSDVDFIATSEELIDTICQMNINANAGDKPMKQQSREDIFFTDADLPRWHKLLNTKLDQK